MSAPMGPKLRAVPDTTQKVSSLTAVRRAALLLLTLTNPVAVVLGLLLFAVLTRFRRVRGWWVTAAGAVLVALLVLVWTQAPPYVSWIIESVSAVLGGGWTRLLDVAAQSWPAWLRAQLPLASGLAVVIAGVLTSWRRQWMAPWRADRRARRTLSRDAAVKKSQTMEQWAGAPRSTTRPARRGTAAQRSRQRSTPTLADVNIRMGIDQETRKPADVPLAAFLKHCWIDGASGFGKTTDIITLVRGVVEAPMARELRCPVVYVNLKPDPDVTEALRRIAHHAGRAFHRVTIDGAAHYNPIRHGNAAAVATRIIEVEDAAADGGFTEPYHKANGMELLGYATRALDELIAGAKTYERGTERRRWRRDLWHLHRLMRVSTLMDVRHHLSGELQMDLAEFAEELDESPRKRESCEGMRGRIGKVLRSAAGPVLVAEPDALDLEAALWAGDVVVFDLDSMQDTVAATTMANLVVKDLQAVIAHLGAQGWNRRGDELTRMALFIVDEFSALGGDATTDLLQRGRTNGAGIVLATQDVGSVVETSEGLLTTILTNTNVQMIHVQSERAEDYAGAWGTRKAMKETTQTLEDRTILGTLTRASGQGSLREVEEYVVHPNTLRSLGPGEIILATRDPWKQRRVLVMRRNPEPIKARAADKKDEVAKQDEQVSEAVESSESADRSEESANAAKSAWTTHAADEQTTNQTSPETESEPAAEPAPVNQEVPAEPDPWADDFDLPPFDPTEKETP